MKILERVPYFRGLNSSSLSEIIYNCSFSYHQLNEVILAPKKEMDALGFILNGYVLLNYSLKHLEMPLGVVWAGAVLNYDRAALSLRPNLITAKTLTSATCAWLSYDFLDKLAKKYPSVN